LNPINPTVEALCILLFWNLAQVKAICYGRLAVIAAEYALVCRSSALTVPGHISS